MNKDDLATRIARQSGVSRATAADRLDQVIHDILSKLRRGEAAPLPGLGQFLPGLGFQFESRATGRKEKK